MHEGSRLPPFDNQLLFARIESDAREQMQRQQAVTEASVVQIAVDEHRRLVAEPQCSDGELVDQNSACGVLARDGSD